MKYRIVMFVLPEGLPIPRVGDPSDPRWEDIQSGVVDSEIKNVPASAKMLAEQVAEGFIRRKNN